MTTAPSARAAPFAFPPDAVVLDAEVARSLQSLANKALEVGTAGHAAIGVMSVLHGEGATTVACALANCASTLSGLRVVLVDANPRSPALRALFGVPPGPGLVDVLDGRATLRDALWSADPHNLRLLVLPSSDQDDGVARRLPDRKIPDLVAALHGYAELLVFDGPPLGPYPDATLLARHLDGTVLVLQAERSKLDGGARAVQELRGCGANMLGAILNRYRSRIPGVLRQAL